MFFKRKIYLLFSLFCFLISGPSHSFDPDRIYRETPESLGIDHLSLYVETTDDYKIKVWKLIPEKNENKKTTTIILAYGDSGNMSYFLTQANILRKKGFSVILFDYRGFGESSDFDIDKDYLYRDEYAKDLIAVSKWAKNNTESQNLGVWALSMGTVISTLAFDEMPVNFLIAEGFVVDPIKIKKMYDEPDKPVLLPESSNDYQCFLDKITVPVLIFAGTEDTVTTVQDARLFAEKSDIRELVTFNGSHLQGMWSMSTQEFGEIYFSKMIEFISNLNNH